MGKRRKKKEFKYSKGKVPRTRAGQRWWADYQDYLASRWWKVRRLKAIRKAGFQCEQCGTRGLLEVHHLSYQRLGAERDKDLRALCPPCHRAAHQWLEDADKHLRFVAKYG